MAVKYAQTLREAIREGIEDFEFEDNEERDAAVEIIWASVSNYINNKIAPAVLIADGDVEKRLQKFIETVD